MSFQLLRSVVLSALVSVLLIGAALAADLGALVTNLTTGSFSEKEAAVSGFASSFSATPNIASPDLHREGTGRN